MAAFIVIDQAEIDPDEVVALTRQRDRQGRVCVRILLRGNHAVLVEPTASNLVQVHKIRVHKAGGWVEEPKQDAV